MAPHSLKSFAVGNVLGSRIAFVCACARARAFVCVYACVYYYVCTVTGKKWFIYNVLERLTIDIGITGLATPVKYMFDARHGHVINIYG